MATTTNFGWETPDDTDLVKDGAAAIRTLGGAIDTSLVDLKGGTTGQILSKASNTDMDFTWINNDQGDITEVSVTSPLTGGGTSGAITVGIQDGTTAQKGAVQLTDSTASTSTTTAATPNSVKSSYDLAAAAIPKNTVTTNGDLIYATGSSTVTRLGIGSSGQALVVSGGVPAWGTITAGSNWSLLGSAALTGAQTITISGISGKNKLMILIAGASSASASGGIGVRMNGDTASNYYSYGAYLVQGSSYSVNNMNNNYGAASDIRIGDMSSAAASILSGYALIDGCNTSGVKAFTYAGAPSAGGGNTQVAYWGGGYYNSSSTISSISLYSNTGNFDAGNIYVYSSVN